MIERPLSPEWQARRELLKQSAIGDFIWLQLQRGKTPGEIKRVLAAMVDDLAARDE